MDIQQVSWLPLNQVDWIFFLGKETYSENISIQSSDGPKKFGLGHGDVKRLVSEMGLTICI